MTASQVQWDLEPCIVERLIQFAKKRGQTPEAIITEAVLAYLETQVPNESTITDDPLIGLFSGSSKLAERAEEYLRQSITSTSG
jgi:hypothetical protein